MNVTDNVAAARNCALLHSTSLKLTERLGLPFEIITVRL